MKRLVVSLFFAVVLIVTSASIIHVRTMHAAPAPQFHATSAPCTVYRIVPHGSQIQATAECLSHALHPNRGSECPVAAIYVYQNSNDGGYFACFGPGNYDLDDFCMQAGLFGCALSWGGQISSYVNDSGDNGYFTTSPDGSGRFDYFSAWQYETYIGDAWNDVTYFLHLN